PALSDQEDDHLDSLARAVTDSPERVGKIHSKEGYKESPNWRVNSGVYEAALDFKN
ncbi:MAG: transcriptional regulator, partial [Acinetobacter sp.]